MPEGVFDAFRWCASRELEWRRPSQRPFDVSTPVDGSDPTRMVFVFHAECTFLPRELAALHATGMGLVDEWALAPYAIDDATDLLYERRVRPRDVLWIAAASLPALVWGLHDWVHFHNHGPFDEPAMTELQCDLVALAWLRLNASRIGVSDDDCARVAADLASLSRARFASEGAPPPADVERLFAGAYPDRA